MTPPPLLPERSLGTLDAVHHMSDEQKAFLQFIDDISGMNVERDWKLIAPRLLQLGDAYIASLPWHKRLRFRFRSRVSSAWLWFDWWVIIPVHKALKRGIR